MTDTRGGMKGLNILCIGKSSRPSLILGVCQYLRWNFGDGGGARGLTSLVILREFMHRINSELQNEGASLEPCEHFDIIAGTGTGGVSACMLGRLRMPIDKAIEEYSKLMKKVFSEKKMTGPTLYKGTKLQEALRTMIQDATGNSEEPMIQNRDQYGCRTMVFAMASHNLGASIPVLFRSYHATSNPSPKCAMWQTLYATMAHPDLFKSIDIVDCSVPQSFVGGELGCSNPLGHVLSEIKRVLADRQVACIVSIGSGHARTIQVPRLNRWESFLYAQDTRVIEAVKAMATDSERTAEEMAGRFRDTSEVYFRFNVDQGMQDITHGSWERLNEAMEHAKLYLHKSEVDQRLEQAVSASRERRGAIPTTYIDGRIIIPDIAKTVKQSGPRVMDEVAMNNRLDRLSPSLSARYNSVQATELKRGPCTNGTRVDLLAQVLGWVGSSIPGSTYWVAGMAGTGKTTIAYSLCQELDANQQLGASFFCSRLLPECRDVNLIIPSIAYQLARSSLTFRSVLSGVLEKDPDVHTRLQHLQFDSLIVQPLLEIKELLANTFVVVIDALDECDNKQAAGQILDILLTKTSNLPLKFIVASRPEPEIRDEMQKQNNKAGSRVVLHELDGHAVRMDIETYLRASLAPMKPTDEQISQLVERAGVLFIYAATVVRYVGNDRFRRSDERLQKVLEPSSHSENKDAEIDELYTTILRAALDDRSLDSEEREDMCQVLHTVICVQEPLTVEALSRLMRIKQSKYVRLALDPLWSVLHISGGSELVTTLHASFLDYMFDLSRSKEYHCDRVVHNQLVTRLCFDCIGRSQPQVNICGLESSFVPDDQVEGIEERVYRVISIELFYASRYWAVHLQYTAGSPDLMQQLEEFLSTRLLLWMEVMNLKKCANDMPHMLRMAELLETERSAELDALIHDAWRFTSTFALGAAVESTPHIYTSMLAFWPEDSPVSKCYRGRMQGLINTKGAAISRQQRALIAIWSIGWPAELSIFAFNETQVAVGVRDEVHLLSSSTGRAIFPPFGAHQKLVSSIDFSPDGSRLVSSDDKTVYVWSTQSGEIILGPLEGIAGLNIIQTIFSPDDGSVVSLLEVPEPDTPNSDDSPEKMELHRRTERFAIRIWDALGGIRTIYPSISEDIDITASSIGCLSRKQCVVFGHNAGILIYDLQGVCTQEIPITVTGHPHLSQVQMSPNGTQVAAVLDGSIFIWDLVTGDVVFGPLEINSQSWVDHISVSPNGFYLTFSSLDTIYMWDVRNKKLVLHLLAERGFLLSPRFSPDGAYIMCGSHTGELYLWDARSSYKPQDPLPGHTSSITSVAFHPDGTRLISGSNDGTACVWDAVSGEMVLGLQDNQMTIPPEFSPDGSRIIRSRRSGLTLSDAQNGHDIVGPLEVRSNSLGVAFSPDGICIAIVDNKEQSDYESDDKEHPFGDQSDNVRMIVANTGKTLWSARLQHKEYSLSPTFSPDGVCLVIRSCLRYIVSDLNSDRLYVYDAQSGELLNDKVYGNFHWSEMLPDGTGIISFFRSQITVQDIKTGGKELRPLGCDTDRGYSLVVKFSPDCTRIAFVAYDRTLYICDTHTGQLRLELTNWHTSHIYSMSFSPDLTQIASGSLDRTIRVTDIQATPTLLPNSSPDGFGEWSVRDDGWVVDESSNLLVWIPPNLRASLMLPRTKILISRRGYLRLSFEGAYVGELWERCYQGL